MGLSTSFSSLDSIAEAVGGPAFDFFFFGLVSLAMKRETVRLDNGLDK